MNRLALAALLAGAAAPAFAAPRAATEEKSALPFIEDDYPKALALAKERNLPLFVDGWAPWSHPCRFMRGHVLNDPALTKNAGRFVWLAIDTDRKENKPFLAKVPMDSIPAFVVI